MVTHQSVEDPSSFLSINLGRIDLPRLGYRFANNLGWDFIEYDPLDRQPGLPALQGVFQMIGDRLSLSVVVRGQKLFRGLHRPLL